MKEEEEKKTQLNYCYCLFAVQNMELCTKITIMSLLTNIKVTSPLCSIAN